MPVAASPVWGFRRWAPIVASLLLAVGPGDEVIVPPMTFAASANAARYVGADVVFADVRPDTLTIDPNRRYHGTGRPTGGPKGPRKIKRSGP